MRTISTSSSATLRGALLGGLLLTGAAAPFGAAAQRVLWSNVEAEQLTTAARRSTQALDHYRVVSIQTDNLRAALGQAPDEATAGTGARRSATVISLPLPDGTSGRFRVVETHVMHPQLAARYPMIKTYAAQGIDDPTAVAYLDLSPAGLHAMIVSPNNTVMVDPTADKVNHIVFYKRDINRASLVQPLCYTQAASEVSQRLAPLPNATVSRPNGTQLRTFRLAMACTGEYAARFGSTTAGALAAIVTSMNRVSGVYEKEIAIRFQLIPNNDVLIFTDPSTDPYTNQSNGATLNTNQTVVDQRIGAANYDIGHVFNTDGGGIAGLGVVCRAGNKARGTTGLPNPVGDAFDIDFVAHEIGHQFGGNHTFNSNSASNCSAGTRSNNAAYEPGSGSTIMGYAGICSPQNLQSNSDPYFHTHSYDEILNHVNGLGSCATQTPTNNRPPVIDAGPRYVIPQGTPFELTGTGSDPDGDALTYCWEQYDLGPGGSPTAPSGDAPIFRSFNPTTSPSRTFPRLANIINNNATIGEILPTYGRRLNFRLTARDNRVGGGGTAYDTVSVPVVATAGPFVVTAPNTTGVTWRATVPQQVSWNVAGTTAAPISAANVDIMLSVDGGLTFPYTLLSNTPNDGSEQVTVPGTVPASTQARIKIKASNNIFFDMSNANFTLQVPTAPGFFLSSGCANTAPSFCPGSSASCSVSVGQVLGFTGQVTLSASNLPTGVTVTFANNQVAAGSSANFTINASAAAASGTYVLNIVGTDGSQQEIQPITLVLRNVATVPVLQAPAANLQRTLPLPTFEWSAVPNATSYDLQVATDANFTNPIINQTGLTTNTFTATTALQQNGRYFWRVRSTAECGVGAWSAASPFAVGRIACTTYASTNVPATIGASSSENVLVPLTLSNVGAAAEIRVRNLSITHPNTGELIVSLLGPSGRSVTLATVPCNGSANLNANFDDAAASALTCPANLTPAGTYRPQDPLSVFRGLTADGQWTLLVRDIVAGNGGTVNSWSLDVCSVQDALSKREAQQMHGVSVFPNPSTGLFELNVDNAQRGTLQVRVTDAVGRVVLTQEITKGNGLLHHTLDLGKLSRGVYQLHLELPGGGSAVEKLMKL